MLQKQNTYFLTHIPL